MTRRTILLALALTFAAVPGAHAQGPRAAEPRPAAVPRFDQAVVALTVRGRLQGPGSEPGRLPVELLRRLSREAPLARVDVAPAPGTAISLFSAAFVFDSQADFEAWYQSEPTRALLADVNRAVSQVSVEYSIQRFPNANVLPRTAPAAP